MTAPARRFATLEAAQAFIMIDLLGHDEGAWEIVDARTGVALPDGDRES